MSKKSEEIAAKIKELHDEQESFKKATGKEITDLRETLFVQEVYDSFNDGTTNLQPGKISEKSEKLNGGYITRTTTSAKSTDGEPCTRIVTTYGDTYDDDSSETISYVTRTSEDVKIGIVNTSVMFGDHYRIYSYDEKAQSSELILKSEGRETPDDFKGLSEFVDGTIEKAEQDSPTE